MTTEYYIMKWKDFSVAELRIIGKSFNKYIKIGPVSKIPKKDLIVLLEKDLNLNETTGEVTMKAGGMTLGRAKLELTEKGKQKTAKAAAEEAKAIYASLRPDILGAGEAEARALYASLKPDVLKTSEQMMGAAADAASISDQVALMMKDAEIRMAEMRLQTLMATREKIVEAAAAPAKKKKIKRVFFNPDDYVMEDEPTRQYRQTLDNDYRRSLKEINFLIEKSVRFGKDRLEELKTLLVNAYTRADIKREENWKSIVKFISDAYRQETKGKRVEPNALQIELFQRKFKDDYEQAISDLEFIMEYAEKDKDLKEVNILEKRLEQDYKFADERLFTEVRDKIKELALSIYQS